LPEAETVSAVSAKGQGHGSVITVARHLNQKCLEIDLPQGVPAWTHSDVLSITTNHSSKQELSSFGWWNLALTLAHN